MPTKLHLQDELALLHIPLGVRDTREMISRAPGLPEGFREAMG